MLDKVEAVLFDMDGTLVDSKAVIEQAWCSVALQNGIEVDHNTIEKHIHGRSGQYTLDYLFHMFNNEEKAQIKHQVDSFEETARSDLIAGAEDFLILLKQRGIKIALVTASWSERIEFLFSLHQLHRYFDTIVARHQVQQGKPHPEGFLTAAKQLGIDIEHCLVFEDSLSGIEAGMRSGARCIAIGDINTQDNEYQPSGTYQDFNVVLSTMSVTPAIKAMA
ncbi:HAD family phosphatase [Vibrio profundum]|uniref:HAD family hydrolase n=1 Tax=Vibrio profundum TaxID=2910247 RepID=UPI003D13060E